MNHGIRMNATNKEAGLLMSVRTAEPVRKPGFLANLNVTCNAVVLNVMFICSTMLVSVLIAIAISGINNRYCKKTVQSIVILPHFIFRTVIALLCESLLKTSNGFVNNLIVAAGGTKINFCQRPDVWLWLLTILHVRQGAGYGSIVYLASITGIDQSICEAARIDGASRAQCIWDITLPVLRTTAMLLMIMNVGKIFNGDFGMICNHIVDFNPDTLAVEDIPAGQGWTLYGFTLSHLHTGKPKYLNTARKVADYFISQVQEDWVPRCDFRQPEGDPLKDACVRWTKAPPTGATASPPSSTSAPAPTTARATTTTSP